MSTQVVTGLFKTTAASPYFIPLQNYISEIRLKNLTRSGVTAGGVSGSLTSDRIVEAFWCDYMSQGTAQIVQNGTVAGILAPTQNGYAAINGFTIFNGANPPTGPVLSILSFTPGTTTVFTTSTNHGYQVGDTVRIWSMTSAPQFGGLAMTVTATNGTNTFTTLLDSTGATTSVGSVQKIGNYLLPTKSLYYPQNRVIAKMTNANPMVVTTLVQQNYAAGDVVTFDMPSIFGVPQLTNSITGLPFQATVIAANNAVGTQTVTLAVDSTNFGVFATTGTASTTNPTHWPLSGAYPFTFPQMVPQGEGNINNFQSFGVVPAPLPYANQDVLSFARQNLGQNGILVGAGDGTNSASTGGIIGSTTDVWQFRVVTSAQEYPQPLSIQYV